MDKLKKKRCVKQMLVTLAFKKVQKISDLLGFRSSNSNSLTQSSIYDEAFPRSFCRFAALKGFPKVTGEHL